MFECLYSPINFMPQVYNDNLVVGNLLYQWTVKEYEKYSRRLVWYILMLVLGGLLVGYAMFTSNFLFAIVIVLFAIILFLQSHQDPVELPVGITELGILINTRFYTYSELENFYIIYNPPEVKTLFIETKGISRPRLRIPLEDIDPNDIRFLLREYVTEDVEKEEEPFSDTFARKWQIH